MKKSTRLVSFILAAVMSIGTTFIPAEAYDKNSAFTDAASVSISFASADPVDELQEKMKAHAPEAPHIYVCACGKKNMCDNTTAMYKKDNRNCAYISMCLKSNLKSELNKAYSQWESLYGDFYGAATAKVFYCTGKTATYTKSESATTTKPDTTDDKPEETTAPKTTSTAVKYKEITLPSNVPEPVHVYEINQVNGKWKVGTDFRTTYSKDISKYNATTSGLNSSIEKSFKSWEQKYGNKYTYAYAKVYYYNGKIAAYRRKANATETTTTPETATAKTVDTKYKNTYLYKQLSAAQQKWVDWVISGDNKGEPQLSESDKDVAIAVRMRIDLDLRRGKGEKYQKAYKTAKKIVAKAHKQKTDYDKIKTIHDELCKYAAYGNSSSYVELLANGSGDCHAYSSAFAYLCQLAGIDCFRVGGIGTDSKGSQGAHEWNMIKLDGNWYYVDLTWDDCLSNYKYFLKGSTTMNKTHRIYTDNLNSLYPTASKSDYKYPETPKFTIEKVSVCPDEIHIYETENGEVSSKFKVQYKKDGSSAQTCGIGATDVAICMMMSNKESVYKSEFEYFNVKIYYYSGELKSFKAKTSDYRGKYRDLIGW